MFYCERTPKKTNVPDFIGTRSFSFFFLRARKRYRMREEEEEVLKKKKRLNVQLLDTKKCGAFNLEIYLLCSFFSLVFEERNRNRIFRVCGLCVARERRRRKK